MKYQYALYSDSLLITRVWAFDSTEAYVKGMELIGDRNFNINHIQLVKI